MMLIRWLYFSSIMLLDKTYGESNYKKNFLFIIVDDLRTSLGCYDDPKAHTPNIDKLAKQSVLFDRAYAQQSLCAPSRNSLLTSRRPDTLGLYDFYSYWRCVSGNFTTLPQHLKNNGYVTASIGKVFHPGASCNWNDDSPHSWSEKPFHPETEEYKDAPVCKDDTNSNAKLASNLICPVQVTALPNSTLPDLESLRAARRFLRRKHNKPFFIAVGFQKPHIPLKYPRRYLKLHPLKKFSLPDNYEWPANVSSVAYNPWTDLRRRDDVEKLKLQCPWQKIPKSYGTRIIQSYYAAVTYIDELVGELLVELEVLKIRNDTIVILTSDHGWSLGEHSLWAKYSNFEVALRVPLMISIPGVTYYAQGKQNDSLINCDESKNIKHPVELLDLFPTVAEMADVPIVKCPKNEQGVQPPDLCSEGISLIPLIDSTLKNRSINWNKPAISQYPRPGMVPTCHSPSSDEPKLRDIKIMGYTLRTERYRYTVWFTFSHASKRANWEEIHAEELYDHVTDDGENVNLAYHSDYNNTKTDLTRRLMQTLQVF